jgi:hypothetical protein
MQGFCVFPDFSTPIYSEGYVSGQRYEIFSETQGFLKNFFYNVNINKFVLKKNRKRQNPVVFPCNFAVEKQ